MRSCGSLGRRGAARTPNRHPGVQQTLERSHVLEAKPRNESVPLWLIVVLLVLVLGSNLYTIFTTHQAQQIEAERAATHSERVEAARELLREQREAIADLVTNDKEDAYRTLADSGLPGRRV
jgi:predicted metalloprotease